MKDSTKILCRSAVFLALVFVVTRFIQIPIPLGYLNVGNAIILIGCVILPCPYGIIVGSIASCFADVTSYIAYAIPTLIIKALMPFAFYGLKKGLPIKNVYAREIVAAAIATLIPLVGYTLTGGFLYGGLLAGLAQLPGLGVEYVANLILFAIFLLVIRKNKAVYKFLAE